MNKHILFVFLVLFSFTSHIYADSPTIHVVTVASKKTLGFNYLMRSCEYYNIPIHVLGMRKTFRGPGQKLSHMKKFVENIPDTDVVMFVDGYDTLILASKKEILDHFLKKNVKCIFSSDTMLGPGNLSKLEKHFPCTETKLKYLNSGVYIGYAGYLKNMFNEMEINEYTSDQVQCIKYYITHTDEILLDYNCEFAVPLNHLSEDEIEINIRDKIVTYLEVKTTPFVIHGNALGRELYLKICSGLFPD